MRGDLPLAFAAPSSEGLSWELLLVPRRSSPQRAVLAADLGHVPEHRASQHILCSGGRHRNLPMTRRSPHEGARSHTAGTAPRGSSRPRCPSGDGRTHRCVCPHSAVLLSCAQEGSADRRWTRMTNVTRVVLRKRSQT